MKRDTINCNNIFWVDVLVKLNDFLRLKASGKFSIYGRSIKVSKKSSPTRRNRKSSTENLLKAFFSLDKFLHGSQSSFLDNRTFRPSSNKRHFKRLFGIGHISEKKYRSGHLWKEGLFEIFLGRRARKKQFAEDFW